MKQSFAFVITPNTNNITYSFNIIDDTTRAITGTNQQASYVPDATETEIINAISVLNNKINTILNPATQLITGMITIKYVDSNGNLLENATVNSNLPLATYVYTAKQFVGYNLADSNTKTIILDTTNTNAVITFTYTQIVKGNITIKYQDQTNTDIATADTYNNLDMGTYIYQSKDLTSSGYTLVDATQTSQTVTLNSTNTNAVITFTYKKITGSVTENYVDGSNNVIQPATVNSGLVIGTPLTYEAPTITGYTLSTTDTASKSVTLTADNANQSIQFIYDKVAMPSA